MATPILHRGSFPPASGLAPTWHRPFLTGIAILATSWTRIWKHAFRYSAGAWSFQTASVLVIPNAGCRAYATSQQPTSIAHLGSLATHSRYAMNCVEYRTLDQIIELLLALPASRSTGLQPLRRHDRLASSACTRFKVALSMTAYSTGHSLVHDDDEICAYSMLSKVNKVPPLSGGPATAYTKAWFNIVRRAMR